MDKIKLWQRIGFISLVMVISTVWMERSYSQEKYPTRAIDVICPTGAGGGNDLQTRVMTAFLNKKWAVPVNVLNKPGGNSIPGTLEVYNARPDGYTVLVDSLNTSLLPAAVRNLPFKIMDRTHICTHSAVQQVFYVPASSPLKNMKDLEAEAKKDPGIFTWTSMGGTGGQDFAARQFFKAIGLDVLKTKPVMVQSGAQCAAMASGGHVILGISATASSLPAIKGGLVKPLAISGSARWPELPDVPTTSELGYPLITAMTWVGFSGPPNLPPSIVEAWNKAILEMMKDPEVIAKLKNIGAMPFYHNAQDTRDYVAKEIEDVYKLWGLK
jgi:tripartite-type tricarboxylate transporter receptor subunit TctC